MSAGTTGPAAVSRLVGLVTDASGDDLASPAYVATVVAAVTTLRRRDRRAVVRHASEADAHAGGRAAQR